MRIPWLIALAALVTVLPAACVAQTMRFEAETATLTGPNLRVVAPKPASGGGSPMKFSGSGYITGFQSEADQALFYPKLEAGGQYQLAIGYRSKGRRGYEIEIDGLKIAGMMENTSSGEFGVQALGRVELERGRNTVTIHRGWGFYDVDYIELTPAGSPGSLARITSPPTDLQATVDAQALLRRLQAGYGKTTMVGVYKDRDSQYVLNETGVRPAIMGGDLLAYSPQEVAHGTHPERDGEVERLIARAKEGYLITLSWHWCAPSGLLDTKEEPWHKCFYTEATRFDLAKALADPASIDYALLLRDIDAIAIQLRKLQDANVPVLWRPLHEAEGGWFWWGAKGPKPFVQLWQLLYDRLTKTDGIHNLIWVYTSGVDSAWYPGDAYVDVIGIDAYPKDLRDPQSALWDELRKEYGDRKILTISEFGGVPDIPRMQRMGEFWSYAVSWSDEVGPKENSPEELRRIFTDKGVVTQPGPDVANLAGRSDVAVP